MSAREIAGIAFGRERKGILVNLRAYFDGSGKEDDHPVITVGGYMADADLCDAIEDDWVKAMHGRTFHLADSDSREIEFHKRLAGLVNREGVSIISASLEIAPFYEVLFKNEHPQEIGPAFSACAYAAVAFTELILAKQGRQNEKVHYVFEKGDREHEVSNIFKDWDSKNSRLSGLRGHSFEPKQGTPLLHPTDLIAGVVQRCVMAAYGAFPSLDNGIARTQLQTFERHYSPDGLTSAVVRGHDGDKCWIVNARNFSFLDGVSIDFFKRHPDQLKTRRKRLSYRPKPKKVKHENEPRIPDIQQRNENDSSRRSHSGEGRNGGRQTG